MRNLVPKILIRTKTYLTRPDVEVGLYLIIFVQPRQVSVFVTAGQCLSGFSHFDPNSVVQNTGNEVKMSANKRRNDRQ